MIDQTQGCLFCGATPFKRANEHAFAKWLLKHLAIEKFFHIDRINNVVTSEESSLNAPFTSVNSYVDRKHALSAWVNGDVCDLCNNEWMSELETKAAPMLIALMDGSTAPLYLSFEQRLILARWATKTAYAFYFTSKKLHYVSRDHPRQLKSDPNSLPRGVFVFAAQNDPSPIFDYLISSDWELTGDWDQDDAENLKAARLESYKISFQLARLHLLVAYLHSDQLLLRPIPGMYEVVYPPSPNVIWSPDGPNTVFGVPKHITQSLSPECRHFQFHYGLAVCPNPARYPAA